MHLSLECPLGFRNRPRGHQLVARVMQAGNVVQDRNVGVVAPERICQRIREFADTERTEGRQEHREDTVEGARKHLPEIGDTCQRSAYVAANESASAFASSRILRKLENTCNADPEDPIRQDLSISVQTF